MSKSSRESIDAGLGVALCLIESGVPVVLMRPAFVSGEWDASGGTGGTGFVFPSKWQNSEPDADVISRWQPGDALAAVMGHTVDGLDFDPRHKGHKSASKLRKRGLYPESLGHQLTPSGGWHDLIRPLGIASRDNVMPGFDYKAGGTPGGTGWGMLFIAPTVRLSKVDGKPRAYRWETPPTLQGLLG